MSERIIAQTTRVETTDPILETILPKRRATYCNTEPQVCERFNLHTQGIGGSEGRINPVEVRVGLCDLTGVACLKMAQIIAQRIKNS